jgi:hypothetical protein
MKRQPYDDTSLFCNAPVLPAGFRFLQIPMDGVRTDPYIDLARWHLPFLRAGALVKLRQGDAAKCEEKVLAEVAIPDAATDAINDQFVV